MDFQQIIIIYVLRLKDGKWYIGKTNDAIKRFMQHLEGNGSAWTKMYEPIEIVEEFRNVDSFDEDKITKQYMAKYGIENVRGGTYTQINLDNITITFLQKEIWSAQNKCFKCGNIGHFANKCTVNINEKCHYANEYKSSLYPNADNLKFNCNKCNKEFNNDEDCMDHTKYCNYQNSNVVCYMCGAQGHYSNECIN